MKPIRFIAVSFLVTLTGFALFLWVVFCVPDRLLPTDPPPSIGAYLLGAALFVVSWPTFLFGWLFGESEMLALNFIPSGLLWGLIIELVCKWRAGKRTVQGDTTNLHPVEQSSYPG
jgi:hypothetical protein